MLKSSNEIRDEISELRIKAQAIVDLAKSEERELSDEEQKSFDQFADQADKLEEGKLQNAIKREDFEAKARQAQNCKLASIVATLHSAMHQKSQRSKLSYLLEHSRLVNCIATKISVMLTLLVTSSWLVCSATKVQHVSAIRKVFGSTTRRTKAATSKVVSSSQTKWNDLWFDFVKSVVYSHDMLETIQWLATRFSCRETLQT